MADATSNPAVELPPQLYQRLLTLAAASGRSIDWLVERILADGLTDAEAEIAAVKAGLDAAKQGRGKDAKAALDEVFDKLRRTGGKVARKAG